MKNNLSLVTHETGMNVYASEEFEPEIKVVSCLNFILFMGFVLTCIGTLILYFFKLGDL